MSVAISAPAPEQRTPKVLPKRERSRSPQRVAPACRRVAGRHVAIPSELLPCKSLQDWLQPDSEAFRGLHVQRTPTWGDVQSAVDAFAMTKFGRWIDRNSLEQIVLLGDTFSSESGLTAKASQAADRLLAQLRGSGLPAELQQQIRDDLNHIAVVVAKMLPGIPSLSMKLELMGESVCQRWHMDSYVGRAIVSYNGHEGTMHVHNDNVNFWELENCGNNDCILYDKSKVQSISAGDILFIKGKQFPHDINSLVHKAPLKRYGADGHVKHRLCIKVDVK